MNCFSLQSFWGVEVTTWDPFETEALCWSESREKSSCSILAASLAPPAAPLPHPPALPHPLQCPAPARALPGPWGISGTVGCARGSVTSPGAGWAQWNPGPGNCVWGLCSHRCPAPAGTEPCRSSSWGHPAGHCPELPPMSHRCHLVGTGIALAEHR